MQDSTVRSDNPDRDHHEVNVTSRIMIDATETSDLDDNCERGSVMVTVVAHHPGLRIIDVTWADENWDTSEVDPEADDEHSVIRRVHLTGHTTGVVKFTHSVLSNDTSDFVPMMLTQPTNVYDLRTMFERLDNPDRVVTVDELRTLFR